MLPRECFLGVLRARVACTLAAIAGGLMKRLLEDVRSFNEERDWGRFHSPKTLAMALVVEAAELAEPFQWMEEGASRTLAPERKQAVADEIGDVLIYLVNLADQLGIDPAEAARAKLERNRERYPAERVRGSSRKYDEYP